MSKRVGLVGLLAVMAMSVLPATASAQDHDYRRGYAQQEYRDRDWHRDDRWRDQRWREHEWREARERQEWREREWREHHPYYQYRYAPPAFGFEYYGR